MSECRVVYAKVVAVEEERREMMIDGEADSALGGEGHAKTSFPGIAARTFI